MKYLSIDNLVHYSYIFQSVNVHFKKTYNILITYD